MLKLAEWAQRIVTLRGGAVELLAEAGWVFEAHMFLGMSIFFVFPFTRLVHVWSGFATVAYLGRPIRWCAAAASASPRVPPLNARHHAPEEPHHAHHHRHRRLRQRTLPVRRASPGPAHTVATINGIALHEPGLPPPGEAALRELAWAELLRQQAVKAGLLPEQRVLTAPP